MTASGGLIVGTVRAVRDGRHVVVCRDGAVVDVAFEGGGRPLVGADVVGTLADGDGPARMTLHTSVTEALLAGRSRISPAGSRPDITARMLAKLLSRSRGAVLSPGEGVSIERAPLSGDADLDWAISAFRPEADRLDVALNVIDVQAVAAAPWRSATLNDLTLPADVEGNTRAMHDLKRLLATGFHPDCNRMMETITGQSTISVNFVIPYSPFQGATGFARQHGMMDRGHAALPLLTTHEVRQLSAARHVALALAHSKLGAGGGVQADVGNSRRTAHVASSFADAAAALAFLASGGRREAVERYADLKEASLHNGRRTGRADLSPEVLVEATHRAVRAALAAHDAGRGSTAKEVVAEAVRIARRTALPASRFHGSVDMPTDDEASAGRRAATRVALDMRSAGRNEVEALGKSYEAEVRELAGEHARSDLSAARFVAFGSMDAPLAFAERFSEATRHLPRVEAPVRRAPETEHAGPSRLAKRIRARQAGAPDEFGMIEVAEPYAAPSP